MVVQSVCELLIEMMNWVKSKFCVNNFIPGNYRMDHLSDTDLSYEIDALWKTSQSGLIISEILYTCQTYKLAKTSQRRRIESPAWIKRAFIIMNHVSYEFDNYINLFSTLLTTNLQNALYKELSDIYKGLYFQQRYFNCEKASDKHVYFLKSESHLLLAINLCELHEVDMIDNCSLEFVWLATHPFVSSEESSHHVELNTEHTGWARINLTTLKAYNFNNC